MPKYTALEIADHFGMEALTGEGGYFLQTYKSDERIPEGLLLGRKGEKPIGTAILFLMTTRAFSRMHRLASDEVFHFYMGDKVEMLALYPNGESQVVSFGNDLLAGELVQFTVPRGTWFGLRVLPNGERDWALLGTTMAPGYDDLDFEGGDFEELKTLLKNKEHLPLLELLSGPANYDLE
ncbi:MAG: cupin domain-containing protein [Tissierellia bacterium]|nr:cupin domain-containing protein [Tissierellia bacterium]